MLKSGPLRGRTNALLLFLTFGIGQGALLLAQTWLVMAGELSLLGNFGLSFTMATLAYFVIDWGGSVLLARQELADSNSHEGHIVFWNLSAFRGGLAILYCIGLAAYVAVYPSDFLTSYLLAAAPAMVVGALNPTGLIDGLHKSGPNGAAAVLPSLASALGLPLVTGLDAQTQGAMLGCVFTGATALALLFQYSVLRSANRLPLATMPSLLQVRRAASSGGLVLLTTVPTLFFYRVELAASMAILGAETTGIFVYLRQILSAILQGAQFLRRAEFPALVHSVKERLSFRSAVMTQRASLSFVIMGAIAIAALAIVSRNHALSGLGDQTVLFVLTYAITLVMSGCFAATVQIAVGLGRVGIAAAATNFAVLAFTLVTFPAVAWLGLVAFPLIELGLNVVAFAVLVWMLRRVRFTASGETRAGRSQTTPASPD